MSILSIRPRAFRTRNPGRDVETDEARFGTIRNAISMALSDARREREGLGQRLNLYHAQAASLMDNTGEYGQRDQADETALDNAGHSAARARQRLAELDLQIARLEGFMAQVDQSLTTVPLPGQGVA